MSAAAGPVLPVPKGAARVRDRLNPRWRRFADGCNINRRIGEVVVDNGFDPVQLDRFLGKQPGFIAGVYRGSAERAE